MREPIRETYLSLAAFYASDSVRRRSRERDIGLFWRAQRGPSFRAAWVQDTGEVYLFQHALGGRGGGSVHLLGATFTHDELDRRLVGWQDVCGRPGSLDWLLERLTGHGHPPTRGPRRLRSVTPAAA